MKITKTRLKEIIKEEIEAISEESKSSDTTRSVLRQHYVLHVGKVADAGQIPRTDAIKIDALAMRVDKPSRKEDKLSMKDAKEKVSEM